MKFFVKVDGHSRIIGNVRSRDLANGEHLPCDTHSLGGVQDKASVRRPRIRCFKLICMAVDWIRCPCDMKEISSDQ